MGAKPWWQKQFEDLAEQLVDEHVRKMMQGSLGPLPMPSIPMPTLVREHASSSRTASGSRSSAIQSRPVDIRRRKPTAEKGWDRTSTRVIWFSLLYVIYSLFACFTHDWNPDSAGYQSYWNIPWAVGGPIALIVLFSVGVYRLMEGFDNRMRRWGEGSAALKEIMADTPKDHHKGHHEGLFPPDYFTPYCVCPACGEEALHWMRPPGDDKGADLAKCWDANINDAYVIDDALREKLRAYEIIRTCRTCEMSWGQNTPTSTSKEAVHVPSPTPEQEVDDAAGELAKINEDKPPPEPDSNPTWRPLKDVVGRPDSAVPAPIRQTVDPVEQWADAFMDGVAPERTYEEQAALKATSFDPSDIAGSVSKALENRNEKIIRDLREANPTPEKPTANTPMPRPTGGELTQADAQPKIGKDRVDDYRAKGGKMHIVGPGGLVMANKDPQTGVWEVPNKRTTWVGTQRGTPTELTGATPKAIESEIIDAEEVELPKEDQ